MTRKCVEAEVTAVCIVSCRTRTFSRMVFESMKAVHEDKAHVMQAAADISSIIASEKHKKSKINANKMAALALIFHPNMAISASHSIAAGNWAKTDQLVQKAIPGEHFKAHFRA